MNEWAGWGLAWALGFGALGLRRRAYHFSSVTGPVRLRFSLPTCTGCQLLCLLCVQYVVPLPLPSCLAKVVANQNMARAVKFPLPNLPAFLTMSALAYCDILLYLFDLIDCRSPLIAATSVG